jgi:hypothetical protein
VVAEPRLFFLGLALLAGFLVVLVLLFLPLFDGQSALNRLDSLYNSIAKGSADFIPELREQVARFEGRRVQVELATASSDSGAALVRLLTRSGATAEPGGATLRVQCDLGGLLARCLEDSADMFGNRGNAVQARHGMDGKTVLYHWWRGLTAMERRLQNQARYPEAEMISAVIKKGVECAYNFYGIEHERIADKIWVVLLSLVFYIVYTIWYGFALMFMFEGYGLRLSH